MGRVPVENMDSSMSNLATALRDPPSLQVGQDENLCRFSIFDAVAPVDRETLVQQGLSDPKTDRAMGSMMGMAVADSFGHWFEFLPAVDVPYSSGHGFSLSKFTRSDRPDDETAFLTECFTNPANQFQLALGQWTDDASMGLCMADSLIMNRGYNGSDIRKRFWNWWNRGYCNAFRKDPRRTGSVGLGGNISQSIYSCEPGQEPSPKFNAANNDAGNGSLMRLAPVPIFFHDNIDMAIHYASESSFTTHPGPVAAEACKLASYIIVRAINAEGNPGEDPAGFLDQVCSEYLEKLTQEHGEAKLGPMSGVYEVRQLLASNEGPDSKELSWNWKDPVPRIEQTLRNRGQRYNGYPVSAGYWGSYSMDGLAVALWAVRHTSSFDQCIERVINFLGDADSHGSIAGQIAGAMYGYSNLHPRFVEYVNKWDDKEVALRACLLYAIPSSPESSIASPPEQVSEPVSQPDPESIV